MKTDQFEDILRKKLESISPQYHEQDWQNMQQYMHSKKPITSRYTYASVLKYAAAACLVGGFLFLYLSQIHQNKVLKEDVASLQSQIERINLSQSSFMVNHADLSGNSLHAPTAVADTKPLSSRSATYKHVLNNRLNNPVLQGKYPNRTQQVAFIPPHSTNHSIPQSYIPDPEPFAIDFIEPISNGAEMTSASKLHADLHNRLSSKEIRKNWSLVKGNSQKNTALVNQTGQAYPAFAHLDQKVSYRLGIGYQTDKLGSGKSIHGQVLIGKKISFASGITWLKVKPLEFISEKIFRDKTTKEFQQAHFDKIPKSTAIANINISPSLVQIPLTIAFRESMPKDWAYTVGAGTSLNVQSKEKISFDSLIPSGKLALVRDDFERKVDTPLVNSIEISTGIEKAWYPIVLHAEARLYHYFKPLNPVSPRTGPGINLKLSYQLGRTL